MLEEFREQAFSPDFFATEEEEPEVVEIVVTERGYFLGMSPKQRFVISAMLLLIVSLISSLALLVTDTVVLPF